jgi:prepilin-type N-terminal cleavage/methylation domain-containing protein
MRIRTRDGFSLIELMVVVGLFAILAALAMPTISVGDRGRVNNAASQLRAALQTARLRSVAVNRPLQLRLNCPAANQYRIVEAGWGESGRCSDSTYPYPAAADANYQTPPRPRFDGPVQVINTRVSLSPADPALVLQFDPDGRTYRVSSGSLQNITTVAVTVSANGYQRTINVNNLGKVVAQ